MAKKIDTSPSIQRESRTESLRNAYQSNPTVRALIGLVTGIDPTGITTAIDQSLEANFSRIARERQRAFFDDLATGEIYLTEEIIQSDDFLHAFAITYRSVIKTRSRSKIKQFAKMLINFAREGLTGVDQFERFSQILEDLTDSELQILGLFQQEYLVPSKPRESEAGIGTTSEEWTRFATLVEQAGICTPDILVSLLTRITRTGLFMFEADGGGYADVSMYGRLTPLFTEFTSWIISEQDKND